MDIFFGRLIVLLLLQETLPVRVVLSFLILHIDVLRPDLARLLMAASNSEFSLT